MSQELCAVAPRDLGEALDYPDGLVTVLRHFPGQPRSDGAQQMAAALQAQDTDLMPWVPLRYEEGQGLGWSSLVDNVAQLRERLLEGYAAGAL